MLALLELGRRNQYTGSFEKDAATQTEISLKVVVTPAFVQCTCVKNCKFWLPRFPVDYTAPKHQEVEPVALIRLSFFNTLSLLPVLCCI